MHMNTMKETWSRAISKPFAYYSWLVLLYTIVVIVWGAYVRATGSGAGCGSHWPACNGEVFHRPERIETWIELIHRLTSAALGILGIIQLVWAFRITDRGHYLRRATVWAFIFVLIEGALGAGLVLFELVAGDTSSIRALVVGLHLVNTMILVGTYVAVAWYASGGAPVRLRDHRTVQILFGLAIFGMLILSAFGAITALGDTLFPAENLADGLAQKSDPNAHFAVRMRIWHPALAILVSAYIISIIYSMSNLRDTPLKNQFAWLTAGSIILQVVLGGVNVLLLAPVWMQLVHLFLSNTLWISLLLFTAVNAPAKAAVSSAHTSQLAHPAATGD